MRVEETYLKGCFVITPKIINDERGYFFESFNEATFKNQTNVDVNFVQDNQSQSKQGVLRGLHYQIDEHAQAKLVRVIIGKALDVCVDIRPNSSTFGKHFSIVLDDIYHKQLFIPRGFAHGFLVLEDNTLFSYKCDNFYNKESERGIIYNDKSLNIDWGFSEIDFVFSKKDLKLPTFEAVLK